MKEITAGGSAVRFYEETLSVSLFRNNAEWSWREGFVPVLECEEGTFPFAKARSVSHEIFKNGVGTGIRSRFEGFEKDGEAAPIPLKRSSGSRRFPGTSALNGFRSAKKGFPSKKSAGPAKCPLKKRPAAGTPSSTTSRGFSSPTTGKLPSTALFSTDFLKRQALICPGLVR